MSMPVSQFRLQWDIMKYQLKKGKKIKKKLKIQTEMSKSLTRM